MIRINGRAVLWVAICAGCSADGSSGGGLAYSTAAIVDGTPSGTADDISARRNASVWADFVGEKCSGVVISPLRVMSALHCVAKSADLIHADGFLYAPKAGGQWSLPTPPLGYTSFGGFIHGIATRRATFDTMDGIPGSKGDTLSLSTEQSAVDLAIGFTIARIGVGTDTLLPAHPFEPGFGCAASGVPMLMTGYSDNSADRSTTRRKGLHPSMTCGPLGTCVGSGSIPRLYKGDSGGPLFQVAGCGAGCSTPDINAPHIVCGIASSAGPSSTWASLVHPDNLNFVKAAGEFDSSLNIWAGEFPSTPEYPDFDKDGVPDKFDNCLSVPNSDQANFDKDLLGDACDPCRTVPGDVPDQNSNLGAETETGYPHKPDMCDQDPLSVLTPFSDQPLTRTAACKKVTYPGCTYPGADANCAVARGNSWTLASFFGEEDPSATPKEGAGLVAFRACRCDAANDCRTNDILGCFREGDLRNPVHGGIPNKWFGMHLIDSDTAADFTTQTVPYANVVTNSLVQNGAPALRSIYWNYEGDVDANLTPLQPAAGPGATPSSVFKGVVWAWVKNGLASASGLPDLSRPADAGSERRQTVTKIDVTEAAPSSPLMDFRCGTFVQKVTPFTPSWWSDGCLNCGLSSLSKSIWFRYDGAAPVAEAHSALAAVTDVTTHYASHVFDVFGAPNAVPVLASEGMGWARGDFVGAIVNSSTHAVTASLSVSGSTMNATDLNVGSGSGPLVAAFSRRRQELVFFGEQNNAGQTLQQIRRVAFPGATVSTTVLATLDERLSQPLAAVYAPEDDNWFVLDRSDVSGSKVRLLRVGSSNSVERVASWDRAGTFPNVGLTVTARGDLVLSTWSATSYNVVVLQLANDGLKVLAQFSGTGPLLTAAYGGTDGVFAVASVAGRAAEPRNLGSYSRQASLDLDTLGQVF